MLRDGLSDLRRCRHSLIPPFHHEKGVGFVVPVVELVFQRFLQHLAPFFGREGLRKIEFEYLAGVIMNAQICGAS
jgi:hypothetical protein